MTSADPVASASGRPSARAVSATSSISGAHRQARAAALAGSPLHQRVVAEGGRLGEQFVGVDVVVSAMAWLTAASAREVFWNTERHLQRAGPADPLAKRHRLGLAARQQAMHGIDRFGRPGQVAPPRGRARRRSDDRAVDHCCPQAFADRGIIRCGLITLASTKIPAYLRPDPRLLGRGRRTDREHHRTAGERLATFLSTPSTRPVRPVARSPPSGRPDTTTPGARSRSAERRSPTVAPGPAVPLSNQSPGEPNDARLDQDRGQGERCCSW